MNNFINSLKEKGINLSDTQINQFESFYNDIVEKNKVMNLTRITSKEDAYYLHFFDSLMVSLGMDDKTSSILDVGTGAGFPGIPLKIAFSQLSVTMIESIGKKAKFVEEEIEKLHLENARIINKRAEDFGEFESFDYATSRAVAELKTMLPYTIPFLKIGGMFIAMKSTLKAEQEINDAKTLMKKLNCSLEKVIPYTVLDRSYCLVLIKKNSKTPIGYPKPIHKEKHNG